MHSDFLASPFASLRQIPGLISWLKFLGVVSMVTFVTSLIAVPWIIIRLPEDYFVNHWQRVEERHQRHPVMALLILVGRNLLGAVLVFAGLLMLVLPGQGLLTLIAGLCVADFPGRHQLFEYLIRRREVQYALNWIRRKAAKALFVFPASRPPADRI